jgi:hypothetical protein
LPVPLAESGDLLLVENLSGRMNEVGNGEIADGLPISAAASSIVFFSSRLSRKLIRASLFVVGIIRPPFVHVVISHKNVRQNATSVKPRLPPSPSIKAAVQF